MDIKSIIFATNKANANRDHYRILGKSLIDYCIDSVRHIGISHIYILEAQEDGAKEILEFIGSCESVLVLSGDMPLIRDLSIKKALDFHYKSKNDLTLVSDFSNEPGIYIVSKKLLESMLLKADKGAEVGQLFLPDNIKGLANAGHSVDTITMENELELMRVGSMRQLAKCTQIIKERINESHMESGVILEDPTNTYIGPDVSIGYGSTIEPNCILKGKTKIGKHCFIGHNSNIEDSKVANRVTIENSVIRQSIIHEEAYIGPFAYIRPQSEIGRNVRIGDFVEIKNSTIGDNTKVSHLTYVGDADVGEDVNFGCGSILVNYDGVEKHRSNIEDHAFIGCNTKIVSPVNIGKRAYTAAGSTITKDIPEESLGIARSRQENKEGWVANKKKQK
ncbi:MAG: bifunctional UDP-N-acetylglucosamine diphosphorylase/glucosamine-1-phosphate N-acetyltransferase GlmU [Epulopiscium sp.]|nr:bifunctional UDP-N-acetylglucosamine diphosphorylase/glucosamine-1-phosphate N-acetyltransferase GlmU [Candidatus Epulonipiscium sp.]